MIAVFETYQQEDQVLSFDQIIARLPGTPGKKSNELL
jgi:hypothetical protein